MSKITDQEMCSSQVSGTEPEPGGYIWNTPASELKGNSLLVCRELRAVETIPSSSQHRVGKKTERSLLGGDQHLT